MNLWAIATTGATRVVAYPDPCCAPARSASVIGPRQESTSEEVQRQDTAEGRRGSEHRANERDEQAQTRVPATTAHKETP